LSHHTGLNYQWLPSKLLLFGSYSTAFDPSTPVDARTGRIQRNETTEGYEAGLRGRTLAKRLAYSVSGVLLYNHHIARRNPLYNDPVADAAQNQPQLVAAGEERFTGAKFEFKWKTTDTVSAQIKGSYVRAITTASPDLPAEVGRPIARLPAFTLNSSIRGAPPGGRNGLIWGLGWQYVSGYVANYADPRRDFLDYPGYGLVTLNTGYQWQLGKRQLRLDTQLRNALNRDLLASHARANAPRELTVTARLTF
ncbi:MAG: TonB-dependent receptor, partial [Opitutaceae bacterium]|nr:TonB-dependent receptor [Opitutaceae bacterium]